uniref:Uncharacterized protein n=1 Tax=Hordeum vulgare subsp. vulgare TaxID=112509 RepID=A0A8I6WZK0_HORVV
MMNYGRQLSAGPLLVPRSQLHPWFTCLEQKIRNVYKAITGTRTSDVVHHHHYHHHHHHTHQRRRPSMHQHQPRPHLEQQTTPHPSPPDQAVSSAWHHPQRHAPSSSFVFRPTPQHHSPTVGFMFQSRPTGMVPPAGSYAYQEASASGSGCMSEQEEPLSQQNM